MSRNHVGLNARRWAAVRKAALERAGYRSELSGKAGRLEVHHKVALEHGGDPYELENLQVLTRAEHIELHKVDDTPGRAEWEAFVKSLVADHENGLD